MKISCEIIKDLLPLYHDGVCSNESKSLVNEHLMACNQCKNELKEMDDVFPIKIAEQNLKEAEAVQKLSIRWRKGMWKSVLKGALSTMLAIVIMLLVLYIFVDFKVTF